MSNGLAQFIIGKNYTISMTPQDVAAATGVFSDNAAGAQVFNGLLLEHDEDSTFIDDNISPTDGPNSNPVTYEQSTKLTIRELATKYVLGSTSGNKIRKCVLISLYQKIVITEYDDSNAPRSGATGKLATTTYYVKFQGFSRNVPKQQVPYVGTFETVLVSDGVGGYVANPSFA